jgi:hypothetical protein
VYNAHREGAEALRDQAMAHLFEECGWTQEEIAKVEGKSRIWVVYRLRLARFSAFVTSGYICKFPLHLLSERRFRHAWLSSCGVRRAA